MKPITYLAPAVAALAIASPAFSQASARETKAFEAGYEYGYNYGQLAESCLMFVFGHVSEEQLAISARYVRDSEELPSMFKKQIAENFADMARDRSKTAPCNRIVQPILRPVTQPNGEYRRAGNWY